MDVVCSTCLESFTSKCDISTTPCGHVFHTVCIQKWLEKDNKNCPQCRTSFDQMIKLYFSENEFVVEENNSLIELERDMLKLIQKTQKAKSENVELANKLNQLERENLKLQQKAQKTIIEKEKVDNKLTKLEMENFNLKQNAQNAIAEKVEMAKKLHEIMVSELNFKKQCQEMDKKSVTDDKKIKQLEAEVENLSPKPRKRIKVELKKEGGKWKINDEIQDPINSGKYG